MNMRLLCTCFLLALCLPGLNLPAQKSAYPELVSALEKFQLEQADRTYEKAIAGISPDTTSLKFVELVFLQGRLEKAKGNYRAATPLLLKAGAWLEKLNAPNWEINCLVEAAAIQTEYHNLLRAEQLLLRAENILESSGHRDGLTWESLLYGSGLLKLAQHQYAAADSLFYRILSQDTDPITRIRAMYRLGESKLEQEAFTVADSILQITVQQLEQVDPYAIDFLYVWNYLGRLHLTTGQYETAREYFQQAIELASERLPARHPYYGKLKYNLASLYLLTGGYELAEEALLEAEEIYRETFGKRYPYATVLSGLEDLYQKLGQRERAVNYALQQKSIYLESANLDDYARLTNNLSYTYQDLGEFEKADSLLQEAIGELETAGLTKDRFYALLHMNYAILNLEQKHYPQARQSFELARSLIDEIYGKLHPWYAAVINYLAVLYQRLAAFELAEELYLETEMIDRTTLGEKHPFYINTTYNLANFYRLTRNFEKADTFFQRANEGQVKLIYHYYSGFDELTRLDYLQQTQPDFDRYFSFVFDQQLQQPNLVADWQGISLAIKNLALDFSSDYQASASTLPDSTTTALYQQWRETKKTLAQNYIKSAEVQSETGVDTKALEEQASYLEKALIRTEAFNAYRLNSRESYTALDLRQSLDPGEAAIDMLSFRYSTPDRRTDSIYYVALINRSELEIPQMVFLGEAKKLQRMLRAPVRQGASNYIENPRIGQDLYAAIWQPLLPYLKGVKQIHMAAGGLLHQLAFAALPVGPDKLLLDEYNFTYYSNLRAFIETRKQVTAATDKRSSICLLGGAVFDLDSLQLARLATRIAPNQSMGRIAEHKTGSAEIPAGVSQDSLRSGAVFNYLPGTVEEVHLIQQQFEREAWTVTTFLGEAAREENIKQLENEASPGILHMATHGYFFPPLAKGREVPENGRGRIMAAKNPLLRSGLALSGANYVWKENKNMPGLEDGLLTAYEIASMNLSHTRLAVLSACETGLGDVLNGEGVFGLQRAFKLAGVDQLLISLWKVPDRETTRLMQLFYTHYLQTRNATDALYQAQLSLSKELEPFYWAAFIVVE